MSDLLKLAARCEAASGPNEQLDLAIFAAIDNPMRYYPIIKFYTASLDAAMTLVPKGCSYELIGYVSGPPQAAVTAWSNPLGEVYANFGANAALAFCAASLRAIAALKAPEDKTGE